MSVSSLNQTLSNINALKTEQLSGDHLLSSEKSALDMFLNVITLGIYGAYKNAQDNNMRNDLLDLGRAFLKQNPGQPDIPVSLTIRGKNYEICDMPDGGIRLLERESGKTSEFADLSIAGIRDMIFFDLLSHADFFEAMANRMYEDASSFNVDLVGMKQERANACGEASRNMILAYHGLNYDPASNDRFLLEGVSVDDIIGQLGEKGLSSRPLMSDSPNEYKSDRIKQGLETGPLLCQLEGHFVVVHGVNTNQDRVDIFCPLLGNRCCSLDDFNAHLDWDQDFGMAPLVQFSRVGLAEDAEIGRGQANEPNFKSSIIDRLGVSILATGYKMGNSWLKSPAEFAKG